MTISLRFLNPRATCALCGREVDPVDAVVLAETGDVEVDTSEHEGQILCSVTPGGRIVVCKECAAAD